MTKRALIVDDSKTARTVLSGKLKNFGILVETRESAAEAIDYLYEESPDAIFMDYEMPGMDGFQALKVIKSNPNTALIPVMMYTSKAGGLAVSQARALGAVGVLPKQLETKALEAVLRTLHLMPDQDSLVSGLSEADLEGVARPRRPDNVHPIHGGEATLNGSVETVSLPLDSYEQELAGSDLAGRSLRRELSLVEERLEERLDKHFAELHAELFQLEAHQEESDLQLRQTHQRSGFTTLMGAVALVLLFFLAIRIPHWVGQSGAGDWQREVSDKLSLQDDKLNQIGDQMLVLQSSPLADISSLNLPLELLEWAANQGTRFGFGEMPFNDGRAVWLSGLVDQLKQSGFKGTVELRAHYGNFCLRATESGEMVLAEPQMALAKCQFAKALKGSDTWRNEQSVAFANYLNVELGRSGGDVEILLFSNGFSDPLVSYPPVYEVKTAGEWNRVAGANQRVSINLYNNAP
jgi:CheY-like chemotaxis protein